MEILTRLLGNGSLRVVIAFSEMGFFGLCLSQKVQLILARLLGNGSLKVVIA